MKATLLAGMAVLFALTAVVSAEPQTFTDPPLTSDVKGAADDGKARVDDGRSQAESEAAGAQDSAINAKYDALEVADGASSDGQTVAGGFLSQTQAMVGTAVMLLVGLIFGADGVEGFMTSPSGAAAVHAASGGAIVAPDSGLLGFAMVVAAGAVGGALLWVTVLQRVVMLGIVPLLSRIAHSEIYLNDARRLISDLASSNPGLCLNEFVAKTGYSRNAVSYHLFVLEKEDELVSVKDGKYRRYFPRGGKYVNGAKNVVSVLRNDLTLKMAQQIVAAPGTIQRELCRSLGMTASAACWHARRLEELGVIRKERVANTVQYYPGEAVAKYDLAEFGLRNAAPVPIAITT